MILTNQMMFHHQRLFQSHNKNQHQQLKNQLQFHKKEPHKRLFQRHKRILMKIQNLKSLLKNKHLNNKLLLNQSQRLQLQQSLLPRNQLIQMKMKNLTFPHHPKQIINNQQRLLNHHQRKVKWRLRRTQMKMIYHHHQRSQFRQLSLLLPQ